MQPIILNAGCGQSGPERLPPMFGSWSHMRVDIDPQAQPDVVADITDLSPFSDNFADAAVDIALRRASVPASRAHRAGRLSARA